MTETIFNIFLPFEDDCCDCALYVAHETDLSDIEAIRFLQERVDEDLRRAIRVPIAKPFTRAEYYAHIRMGDERSLYDEAFVAGAAGATPLYVTTVVVGGKIMINSVSAAGDPNIYLTPNQIGDAHMDDWLIKYKRGDAFDLPQLIHDDYFLAIKQTYNARQYVSSLKLLLSCIDSISYIECGEQKAPSFVDWLKKYADLTPIGITPEELWELRNGVLHMTNLRSRKVTQKKVRRISVRIGGACETDAEGTYYFDLYGLIQAFAAGLQRWFASYNVEHNKFVKFIERYDETISDSRLLLRSSSRGSSEILD